MKRNLSESHDGPATKPRSITDDDKLGTSSTMELEETNPSKETNPNPPTSDTEQNSQLFTHRHNSSMSSFPPNTDTQNVVQSNDQQHSNTITNENMSDLYAPTSPTNAPPTPPTTPRLDFSQLSNSSSSNINMNNLLLSIPSVEEFNAHLESRITSVNFHDYTSCLLFGIKFGSLLYKAGNNKVIETESVDKLVNMVKKFDTICRVMDSRASDKEYELIGPVPEKFKINTADITGIGDYKCSNCGLKSAVNVDSDDSGDEEIQELCPYCWMKGDSYCLKCCSEWGWRIGEECKCESYEDCTIDCSHCIICRKSFIDVSLDRKTYKKHKGINEIKYIPENSDARYRKCERYDCGVKFHISTICNTGGSQCNECGGWFCIDCEWNHHNMSSCSRSDSMGKCYKCDRWVCIDCQCGRSD